MSLEGWPRLLARFAEEGFDPILVGGLAVEVAGYGATRDVDLLVAVVKFDGIEYAFPRDPQITIISIAGGWVANGRFYPDGRKTDRYLPFDVLNPNKFVGPGRSGESFYAYVRSHSTTAHGAAVADPSVVYYTRLLVPGPHGEAYLLRIIRDLREGAPERWLSDALRIGRRFGTGEIVSSRLDRIREIRRAIEFGSASPG
jgi:hypothetical protein